VVLQNIDGAFPDSVNSRSCVSSAINLLIVDVHYAADDRISLETLSIADCIDSCSTHKDDKGDLDCGLIS
jgi:hypothetical protein